VNPPVSTVAQSRRVRENQIFLVLTIVIGVIAGLLAVLFTLSIDYTSRFLFGLSPGYLRLFLVPAAVSIVTGLLLATVFPDSRGSGVPQTKVAFHLHGGKIRPRVPFGKFLTGMLCIGCGHSMGPEGPSVQIGAGMASLIGRWMQLSPERVKELVPVGAAGALSAAFNTPVAAVIFALEEIIGDMNAAMIGSTVVASVTAVIVERAILGNEPLFHVPAYNLVHPAELAAYAVLGVIGGLISLLFCKGLIGLRTLFLRLPVRTKWLHPAMGGLALGGLLIAAPQIMGVGYEYVDQALNGGLLFRTLVLLCFLKLAATVISYASGNAGGIFAPSLYIGAMAGGALGTIAHRFAPFPTGDPGAYALVGMGTVFAGIIRAPMTSVFMIFEITQDYQIFVPLMVANMLSFTISRRYQPTPLLHALLRQDHIHLPDPHERASTRAWSARDVMVGDASFIPAHEPVAHAWEAVRASGRRAHLIGSRDRLVGIVTLDRLAAAMDGGLAAEPVGSLVDEPLVHAHPDHPLDVVLSRFADSPGLLPIVSREDTQRLEGVVTLEDAVRMMGRARTSPLPSTTGPGV
jgi:chloride channel protein, CIC family